MDFLDELVRLNVLALRRAAASQNELILELKRVGFAPTRIAALLGTTPATVNSTIKDAKKVAAKKATKSVSPAKKATVKGRSTK